VPSHSPLTVPSRHRAWSRLRPRRVTEIGCARAAPAPGSPTRSRCRPKASRCPSRRSLLPVRASTMSSLAPPRRRRPSASAGERPGAGRAKAPDWHGEQLADLAVGNARLSEEHGHGLPVAFGKRGQGGSEDVAALRGKHGRRCSIRQCATAESRIVAQLLAREILKDAHGVAAGGRGRPAMAAGWRTRSMVGRGCRFESGRGLSRSPRTAGFLCPEALWAGRDLPCGPHMATPDWQAGRAPRERSRSGAPHDGLNLQSALNGRDFCADSPSTTAGWFREPEQTAGGVVGG
jgi:hypothetical protein